MTKLATVRKFDGSSEPYSPEKILSSLQAAGVDKRLSLVLLDAALPLLTEHSRNGMITSLSIKEELGELLQAIDPKLAKSYLEFRKIRS